MTSVRPMFLVGLIATAASLAIGAASAQKCTASGVTGRCRNTGACAAIGWSTPGKCPGPDNFQCCTTSTCPGGKCLRTSACGGTSISAPLCPGPADVQCCRRTATPEEGQFPCFGDGISPGTCLLESHCSGKIVPDIVCQSFPFFGQCCTAAPKDLRFDIRVFIPTQLVDVTSILKLDEISFPSLKDGNFVDHAAENAVKKLIGKLINQLKWFGGDNRDFAVSGGSSKADISFTVPTNAEGTSSGFDSLQFADVRKDIGKSKLYFNCIDTSHCGDKGVPNWGCGRLKSGAKPYKTLGQETTVRKIDVHAKSVGSAAGRALVKINVETGFGALFDDAFNKLKKKIVPDWLHIPYVNLPTGPAINADFDIRVTYLGSHRVKVTIAGTHDGFPSYEVYVNGKPLYQFDAIDPSALFPGSDQTINNKTIDLDI